MPAGILREIVPHDYDLNATLTGLLPCEEAEKVGPGGRRPYTAGQLWTASLQFSQTEYPNKRRFDN